MRTITRLALAAAAVGDNGLTRAHLWKGAAPGFDAPARQWHGGQGNWPAQSARVL